jgi:peptide/nickel transport system permease protein
MEVMVSKGKKNASSSAEHIHVVKHSQWGDVWRRLRRNKLSMVGMSIILLLIIMAALAPVIAPYDPAAIDVIHRLAWPSLAHPLGTDNFGRDLLSRIIYGGRTSLLVAIIALVFSMGIGIVLGGVSGFIGGWLDTITMRIMDTLMAIPPILLAVSINAALGSGILPTAFAIGFSGCPSVVRMMRGQVLAVRKQDYIESASVTGSTTARIIFTQVLPNCMAPLIVDASLRIGGNICGISGLSFIGLGVQPPISEWGSIMTAGREFIRSFWPLATFPGIAIALTLFGFNVFGDGLRDALDPKLKD